MVLLSGIYLKLKKITPGVSEELRTSMLLKHYNITKVLDVGANTGQFAESLIDFGYKGSIVSFEPVHTAYTFLSKRAKKYKNWLVAEKCAIGNVNGRININVSESTDFSSIKEIKSEFLKKERVAGVVKKEEVNIFTLDSLEDKYYTNQDRVFLKIDTQGFEKEVILGAENLIKKVVGIKLEIPIRNSSSIYQDVDWDLHYYINKFYEMGFKCVSMDIVSADKNTGEVNELDGIFFRDKVE